MKDFISTTYGGEKLSKTEELSPDMTITNSPEDEYTRRIMNLTAQEGSEE